jgi:hypothetical protein
MTSMMSSSSLGDDMGPDCVDCDQTRVVYEFFSVHVLCGQ